MGNRQQKFKLTFDASMNLSKINEELGKLKNKAGEGKIFDELERSFNKVIERYQKLSGMSGSDLFNMNDHNKVAKAFDALGTSLTDIKGVIDYISRNPVEFIEDGELKKIKDAAKAVEAYQKATNEEVKTRKADLEKERNSHQRIINLRNDRQKRIDSAKAFIEKDVQTNEQIKQVKDAIKDREDNKNKSTNKQEIEQYEYEIKQLNSIIEDLEKKFSKANKQIKDNQDLIDIDAQRVSNAQKEIERINTELKNLDKTIDKEALDKLRAQMNAITEKDYSESTLEDINKEIEAMKATNIEKVVTQAKELGKAFKKVKEPVKAVGNKIEDLGEQRIELTKVADETERMREGFTRLFGTSAMIDVFRRSIRDAYQTVKELDAAMTETAVVTNYSVEKMWQDLPKYTETAEDLGATIQGTYETMTLFYQQGLKTNEVFELGTETMKMARIANLDYANSTDLMTAALRGFNMELSETSAQRVNDVYSELAAITASDTGEIANAMTKTASIAHSANMEFETTAAFLAQMIETTRESAENLGTAMKTIIARFTEMKKNPDEVFEFEGEEVDVNKVDKALKDVGVRLKDTNRQFRKTDDVFLELASKWDTLSVMQQRYVATTAAGSRQQSRFIAMMQNYERTMELVNAANNSAGASQKQFEKTLDSLEAKVNSLHAAWQEFTMSLANNELIKGVVDTASALLGTINDLNSNFSGLGKSVAVLLEIFLGFNAVSGVFNKILPDRKDGSTRTTLLTKISSGYSKVSTAAKDATKSVVGYTKAIKNGDKVDKYVGEERRKALEAIDEELSKNYKLRNEMLNNSTREEVGLIDEKTTRLMAERKSTNEKFDLIEADMRKQKAEQTGKEVGTIIGAAAGAALGSGLGKGINKAFGTEHADEIGGIIGTLVGPAAGQAIGAKLGPAIAQILPSVLPAGAIVAALVAGLAIGNGLRKVINRSIHSSELANAIEDFEEFEKTAKKAKETAEAFSEVAKTSVNLDTFSQDVADSLVKQAEAMGITINKAKYLNATYSETIALQNQLMAQGGELIKDQGDAVKGKIDSAKKTAEYKLLSEDTNARINHHDGSFTYDLDLNSDEIEIANRKLEEAGLNAVVSKTKFGDQALAGADAIKALPILAELFPGQKELSEAVALISENLDQITTAESELYANQRAQGLSAVADLNYDLSNIDHMDQIYSMWEAYSSEMSDVPYEKILEGFKEDLTDYGVNEGVLNTWLGSLDFDDKDAFREFTTKLSELGKLDILESVTITELDLSKNAEDWLNEMEGVVKVKEISTDVDAQQHFQDMLDKLAEDSEFKFDDYEGIDTLIEQLKDSGIEDITKERFLGLNRGSQQTMIESVLKDTENDIEDNIKFIRDVQTKRQALEEEYETTIDSMYEALNSDTDTTDLVLGVSADKKDALDTPDTIDITEYQASLDNVKNAYNLDNKFANVNLDEFLKGLEETDTTSYGDPTQQEKSKVYDFLEKYIKEDEYIKELYNKFNKGEIGRNALEALLTDYYQRISDYSTGIEEIENIEEQFATKDSQFEQAIQGTITAYTTAYESLSEELENNLFQLEYNTANFTREDEATLNEAISNLESGYLHQSNELEKVLKDLSDPLGGAENAFEAYMEQNTLEEKADYLRLIGLAEAEANSALIDATNEIKDNLLSLKDIFKTLLDEMNIDVGSLSGSETLDRYTELKNKGTTRTQAEEEEFKYLASSLFKGYTSQQKAVADGYLEISAAADKATKEVEEYNKETVVMSAADKELQRRRDVLDDFHNDYAAITKEMEKIEKVSSIIGADFKISSEDMETLQAFNNGSLFRNAKLIEGGFQLDPEVVEEELKQTFEDFDANSLKQFANQVNLEIGIAKTKPMTEENKQYIGELESMLYLLSMLDSSIADSVNNAAKGLGGGTEEWISSLDRLYNLYERINELTRQKTNLEKKYQALLEIEGKTIDEIIKNTLKQSENLLTQRAAQSLAADEKRKELQYYQNNSGLASYAKYDFDKQQVVVNWGKYESIANADTGDRVDEYISELENLSDQYEEANDTLLDIDADIRALAEMGRDEYISLEHNVLDVLTEYFQRQIDSLNTVNDSIVNSNSKLFDAVQKSIDKQRRDRENDKTEENIASKESRLSYLMADTSGANALEIMKLQEEIANEKQSYGDSLIDQRLSELQDQENAAAEARQRQIEIAQAQLDYAIENGELWEQVHLLIASGVSGQGKLVTNSQLNSLFANSTKLKGLSEVEKKAWLENFGTEAKAGLAWLGGKEGLEGIIKENYGENGAIPEAFGSIGSKLDGIKAAVETNNANITSLIEGPQDAEALLKVFKDMAIDELNSLGIDTSGKFKGDYSTWFGDLSSYGNIPEIANLLTLLNTTYGKYYAEKHYGKKYATGGLADYTGPAWLDGTKSRPELVLNANDTQNYLRFTNLLDDFMSKTPTNQSTSGKGDNYYEFNIQVDSLANDYDVDKLATRIKKIIVDDSKYRNVQSINIHK